MGDYSWLTNYPVGNFAPYEHVLKHAPLDEVIHLTLDNLLEHDDEKIWGYIYDVIGEHSMDMPAENFIKDLTKLMSEVRQSIDWIIADDGFQDLISEYQIKGVYLNKYTDVMLLRFSPEG